jgi:drug/metabolite transporter (DMT)-like permease
VNRQSAATGVAAGLVSVALWGSWAAVSRLSLTGALDPFDMTMLRFAVAALVLSPVLMRGTGRRGIAGVEWKAAFWLWLAGGAPYTMVIYFGLTLAPAGHLAVIMPAAIVAFSMLGGRILFGERLTARRWAGCAAILAGVAMTGWTGLAAPPGGAASAGWGDAVFLFGALMWSAFGLSAQVYRVDPLRGVAVLSLLSFVTVTPPYLIFAGGRIAGLPLGEVAFQGFFQGFVTAVLALVLYTQSVKHLGAARASLFTALVPPIGLAAAYAVLGEVPDTLALLGGALATGGMVASLVAAPHDTGAGIPGRRGKKPPGSD